MYAPFTQLVPGDELQAEVRWGAAGLRCGLGESCMGPTCTAPSSWRLPWHAHCALPIRPVSPTHPSTRPPTHHTTPPRTPRQVTVELEGEGRPRRLAVTIRRVDLIPISSLAVGDYAGRVGLPKAPRR